MKAKLRRRPISPNRGRVRHRKRWSRKPKPSRIRFAQAAAEQEAQREILRQMPGWVEEDGSASDSSEDDVCPSGALPRTVLGLRCEWAACGQCFESPAQVFSHVFTAHFSAQPAVSRCCRWENCPEAGRPREEAADVAAPEARPAPPPGRKVARGLYSLLAHICERHCAKAALQESLQRRREAALRGTAPPARPSPGEDEAEEAPAVPVAPGGLSAAAMSCLMRFQHETLARQAAIDAESRGPVTRHVRLTAALVLRNLANHCPSLVKRHLGPHQAHLAQLALSNLDSSRVISHILNALDEEDGALEEDMDLHFHGAPLPGPPL